MPTPELHSQQALLDAARSVVVERGARRATVAAIAERGSAPTGSIYHRFESVDELLARAWLRAVRRSQRVVEDAVSDDPVESVVAAALALYEFCLRDRDDAVLLGAFRPADFADAGLPDELAAEIDGVNEPALDRLAGWAELVFGSRRRWALDLLLLALVDLPYGFARRHVEAGSSPPRERRERLALAVRAVLAGADG